MKTYAEFLNQIIDDGIAAAKHDYTRDEQKPHLFGSIAGFDACRGKDPVGLAAVLAEAQQNSDASFRSQEESSTYWFKRCYTLEVEWVCNVVSAMLVNQGILPIIAVTARGVMKAAEVLGVGQ